MRILFLNLLGTDIYNEHRARLLKQQASPGTELVVRNLHGVPKTPFLPTPAVFYNQYFQAVIEAEQEGFAGVATSCCSDPGLKDAKSLVNIPVVGPFEAATQSAPAYGGRLSVIVPQVESGEGENLPGTANWARDLAREYGATEMLASVRSAPADHPTNEESLRLFRDDPDALRHLVLGNMERAIHDSALEESKQAVDRDEASVLFFACAFWGGMLDPVAQAVPATILDPLITVLKYIEHVAAMKIYYGRNRREDVGHRRAASPVALPI
jgi:Asp/Glu/hydantoin racemase